MKLDSIILYNFRNYHKQEVIFNKGVNFFVGNNGSGKTNLLESIYFLAFAKSYKTSEINLIRYSHPFARVQAKAQDTLRSFELKLILSESGKRAMINNVEIKKLSDYIGSINVLAFLPEDLMIIKGSPRDRRYYIDLIYGQMDRHYLNELGSYKGLLKQRNELLKQLAESPKPDILLLDVITEQLAASAKKIVSFRKKFVDRINMSLKTMYQFISDKTELFEFQYRPSIEENIEAIMKSKYKSDLLLRTTNTGPHRDDYDFMINQKPARDNASQGEQRIMVLALILAIAETIYNIRKERPVFLLDDVFSELDEKRQNRLIKYLSKLDAQTIITTTTLDQIEPSILNQAKVFRVFNNSIREEQYNG